MLTIQPISPEQTYPLRHAVLWPDKPLAYVKVDNDAEGYHYGAFLHDELVAVISLFVNDHDARFRKFATNPSRQRQGIGTQLLHHVIAEARRLGATTLWCDARLDAADFYRRFGMHTDGALFYKGTIPYNRMAMPL
ncbi:GNAT family N-acetyltransferase [Fibrisoma montanum]|uniref:GNAT family N-acetyltransferase n=1 Tax=Fibrisoma montanum TaxID=2305895 RepID=A0A418M2R3_9BACT|nr:GNAT family N-acetyltransferase [Fibrisoma montanum]RIV20022.1 GNAT family N-acetyltransferase [Fibrisoma montanum]